MEEGERMEYDNSAYRMYHRLNVEWPCLSFDIITDNLGVARKRVRFLLFAHSSTRTRCTPWPVRRRRISSTTTSS